MEMIPSGNITDICRVGVSDLAVEEGSGMLAVEMKGT